MNMNMKMKFVQQGKYYNILDKVTIDEIIKEKPFYSAKQSLRKVVLRKNPKEGYFLESLKDVRTDSEPKIQGKDRGHFIPNIFKKYLLTKNELTDYADEVRDFFGKGNKENISPQSVEANRNSSKFTGQLRFEQEVDNYFQNTEKEDVEVYFEIEEVTIDEKIYGRRIFIHWYEAGEKGDIHVFIPENR